MIPRPDIPRPKDKPRQVFYRRGVTDLAKLRSEAEKRLAPTLIHLHSYEESCEGNEHEEYGR